MDIACKHHRLGQSQVSRNRINIRSMLELHSDLNNAWPCLSLLICPYQGKRMSVVNMCDSSGHMNGVDSHAIWNQACMDDVNASGVRCNMHGRCMV